MNPNWREQRRQERWERRQERRAYRNPMGGVIWGLILIGGGLLFLLRNLGIVYFDNIGQYWPVILIVIGGSKLVGARGASDVTSGMIIGGLGTVFLLRNLDIIQGNVWGFVWPAVIIAIGLSMLLRNMYGPDWWSGGGNSWTDASGNPGTGENFLHAEMIFSGTERKITSQAFEGGKIAVVFGGADIDLRGAAMQRPEITIHADAVFGGIDLTVPSNWQVEVRGSGVFGTYENQTHPPVTGNAHKLIVKGGAVFGGVTVRN